MAIHSIQLSLFSHQINALCGETGAQLRHAAFLPNIRDRLDYSCAIFDWQGRLCAQAAHIPVHLGSMVYAMEWVVSRFDWASGGLIIFNDPYMGSTHLPGVTLVMPVFLRNDCIGFVANRAHHAGIGSDEPESIPLSTYLEDEGIVLSPQYLGRANKIQKDIFERIFVDAQHKDNTYADLSTQVGANIYGATRLQALVTDMGVANYKKMTHQVFDYAESMAVSQLQNIPNGQYLGVDYMDDGGLGNADIPISVSVKVNNRKIDIDFSGTALQVKGNINCPKIVTADNVETSSRIVDVMFADLAQECSKDIPAYSQGAMNNITMGAQGGRSWSYYETIG